MRYAENNPAIDELAAQYLEKALSPGSANLAATEPGDVLYHAQQAADYIVRAQERLADDRHAAGVFFNDFVPALHAARSAAHDIDLTQGEFTPADEQSLADSGAGLKDFRSYLMPFVMSGVAISPEDMPSIGMNAFLRMDGVGYGGNAHVYPNSLSVINRDPSYNNGFDVPVLLDETTYTLDDFSNIGSERADGFAGQVVDTWKSIRESERDDPSFTGSPLVMRAAAVLPVLPSSVKGFEIDFVPTIRKSVADQENSVKRAYDARLLVRGESNAGANYIDFQFFGGNAPRPIFADNDGKKAALTVRRAESIGDTIDQFSDLGLTPRSQGAIALFLAPQVVKEKPRTSAETHYGVPGGGSFLFGDVGGGLKGLGGASVGVGPAGWSTSEKRQDRWFDRIAPELIGRPIIVSMQLFTMQK